MGILKVIERIIDKHISTDELLCKKCVKFYNSKGYKNFKHTFVSKGLFKNVLAIDFFSYYPSIMYTFNIFPDTIFCKDSDIALNLDINDINKFICLGQDQDGIVYRKKEKSSKLLELIRSLLSMKRQQRVQFDNNITYKILLNSFYGVFLNKYFKYYCPIISVKILELGGKILRKSIWLTNYILNKNFCDLDNCNLLIDYLDDKDIPQNYVIYSDTDSIFVNMENFVGKENMLLDHLNSLIIKMINYNFGIPTEDIFLFLKIDGVYKMFLNYGVCKKYFALTQDNQVILKGIHSFNNEFIGHIFKKFLCKYIFVDQVSIKNVLDAIQKLYLYSKIAFQNNDHRFFAKISINLNEYFINKKNKKYYPLYIFEQLVGEKVFDNYSKTIQCSVVPICKIFMLDKNGNNIVLQDSVNKIYIPVGYPLNKLARNIEFKYDKNFEVIFGRELNSICSMFFEMPLNFCNKK